MRQVAFTISDGENVDTIAGPDLRGGQAVAVSAMGAMSARRQSNRLHGRLRLIAYLNWAPTPEHIRTIV